MVRMKGGVVCENDRRERPTTRKLMEIIDCDRESQMMTTPCERSLLTLKLIVIPSTAPIDNYSSPLTIGVVKY
jgi:hypothetical protein